VAVGAGADKLTAVLRRGPLLADLMEILACPVDHAELTLAIDKQEGGEIVAGTLTCTECGNSYPIVDSIPNLLPPDMR
jgi:uncharacterized protein YbaR (Trm112 family)